jgi:hypothetical protein
MYASSNCFFPLAFPAKVLHVFCSLPRMLYALSSQMSLISSPW